MSGRAPEPTPEAPDPVVENIEAILRMQSASLRSRRFADRLSDRIAGFTGTIWFVVLHLVWFGFWVLINTRVLRIIRPFDPYPFQLLAMIVSLEAVLLSTFVLIKQNRMGYLSDRRAHLDLQINLLAERKVTKMLQIAEQIAERLKVRPDADTEKLSQDTQVEGLMQALDQKLNPEA